MNQTESQQVTECPACDSQSIDRSTDAFDGICEACGLVIKDDMDPVELDWLVTDNEPMQQSDQEWLTHASIRNATEQRLVQAFNSLEEFGDCLSVSAEVRQKAADTFCDAMRTGTTDGREADCVIAVCLRIASLEADNPIPLGKLIAVTDIDQKKFRQTRVALQQDLEIELNSPDPPDFLPFLRSVLDLETLEIDTVSSLLEEAADEQSFVGKDPAGIAAAGVYLSHERLTQSDVANAAGVSTETVRQRVSQFRELTDHD